MNAASKLAAARKQVTVHGGIVESETWLVSGLIVRAPASAVRSIVEDSTVFAASMSDEMKPTDAWDGTEYTTEMRTQTLYSAGYDGQYGSCR